jgi:serine/threonine-protein kinase
MFKIGDVIAGKYAVERVLGMGGMGIVVAARHVELDEPVAIKCLLPHLALSGEPVARFLREAKAAIKIKNDHVVRVLDVGRSESGAPYIVMEYLEGCDLGQLVEQNGQLPVEDVVDYVVQACEAIAAAHALGIVHRDLKPANLFLTRGADGAPCVKVLDFGISKILGGGPGSRRSSGLTSTATVMGTPCFMSPEQLRSTRDVDARTDIWSMGAILHALVTGAPPYDGESNADVSAKIIRDPPTPLRALRGEVPAALEAIVLRCLEKEPGRRFPDIAALAHALADLTPRASSKNGAERVARIAAAAAPTLLSAQSTVSVPVVPASSLSPARPPSADPTRTASAWGDTRPEERRGRRIAGIVVAGGFVIAGAVFGTLRLRDASHVAAAAPSMALPGVDTGAPASTTAQPNVFLRASEAPPVGPSGQGGVASGAASEASGVGTPVSPPASATGKRLVSKPPRVPAAVSGPTPGGPLPGGPTPGGPTSKPSTTAADNLFNVRN